MDISCIIEGTIIVLSNGKTKKVEDLTKNDSLLAFDHKAGVPCCLEVILQLPSK